MSRRHCTPLEAVEPERRLRDEVGAKIPNAGLTRDLVLVAVRIMLATLKELLVHQYEASLSALNLCIVRCPDENWNTPVAKWQFCRAAFHAAFFADLYLQPGDDIAAFKRQSFHVERGDAFRDYEELEDRPPVLLYEKPFVLSYLRHVRQKAQGTASHESAETLAGPSGFHWRKCSRAELHVYNIRHIQHHAAQLSLRLRFDADVDIPWVGHEWKET